MLAGGSVPQPGRNPAVLVEACGRVVRHLFDQGPLVERLPNGILGLGHMILQVVTGKVELPHRTPLEGAPSGGRT